MASESEKRLRSAERGRRYRANHPERDRAKKRRYYERNAETIRAKAKAQRAANPDHYRELQKRWNENNPGYQTRYHAENRDRLNNRNRAVYKARKHTGVQLPLPLDQASQNQSSPQWRAL